MQCKGPLRLLTLLSAAIAGTSDEMCQSTQCKISAARLLTSMDPSVEPCDDFYQFACGGYIKSHPVGPSSSSIFDQHVLADVAFEPTLHKKIVEICSSDDKFKNVHFTKACISLARCALEHRSTFSSLGEELQKLCLRNTVRIYKWIFSGFKDSQEDEKLKEIQEVLDVIKDGFAYIVRESGWMDDESANASVAKANEVKVMVGYFSTLVFKHEADLDRRKIDQLLANSFYLHNLNLIAVLLDILNPPYYGTGLDALDFGALGFVLGQNLAHNYLSQEPDENGNQRNLWTEAVRTELFDKEQCFLAQYTDALKDLTDATRRKYVEGSKIPLENDLADNSGLKAAFYAFKQLNGTQQTLVGFEEYTQEQFFFLGFANSLCVSESQSFTEETIFTLESGLNPSRLRVNTTLKNMEEFGKAWNCPRGSKMNPSIEEKCSLF